MKWMNKYSDLNTIFQTMQVTDADGTDMDADASFSRWLEYALAVREQKRYLFLIGNGASSSMASHFATDITKNGRIRTHVFTDSSLLSAVGNDYCFEELYVKPLEWYAEPGDLVIAISSSGNSANILNACRTAQEKKLSIVTLSGMGATNSLRTLGHINFYIDAPTYGLAESGHAVILHHWMDLLEEHNHE